MVRLSRELDTVVALTALAASGDSDAFTAALEDALQTGIAAGFLLDVLLDLADRGLAPPQSAFRIVRGAADDQT